MSELFNDFLHHTDPNFQGGEDYFNAHNQKIGYSVETISGQHSVYDANGQLTGQIHENIHDGVDLFNATGSKIASTMHTGINQSVYDANLQQLGTISQTYDGFSIQDMSGHYEQWRTNIFGGVTIDPLTRAGQIQFPSFT